MTKIQNQVAGHITYQARGPAVDIASPQNKKAPNAATSGALDNVINFGSDHMSKNNKPHCNVQASPNTALPSFGSPEELFQPKAAQIISLDQMQNALQVVVFRAGGLVDVLMDVVEGSEATNESSIINCLWLLQGQMRQLQQMLDAVQRGRVEQ